MKKALIYLINKYQKVVSPIINSRGYNCKYYPGGSKEQTIDAIKKSLIEQKDLLDEILNSNEQNIYY